MKRSRPRRSRRSKPQTATTTAATPAARVVNFHARFTANGSDPKDTQAFLEFWVEASERINELRDQELKRRTLRFEKLRSAVRKTRPIVRAVLRDEVSVEAAARKVKQLVPDKDLARELFDHWQRAAAVTPEVLARQKADMARDEVDLKRRKTLQRANRSANSGLRILAEAAIAGDTDACKDLVELAVNATLFVYAVQRLSPEAIRRLARARTLWPVLANDESGWQTDAGRRIATLDLGADLRGLRVRFRRARGTDANLPARRWAKAAVRVAEETRWRLGTVDQLIRGFGSREELAEFCGKAGWEIHGSPAWGKGLAQLPPFSRKSVPEWKRLVRQIIRQAMPDFHAWPEWENQRRTAAENGRDSVGEVQNAILDDIVSALARVAPEPPC